MPVRDVARITSLGSDEARFLATMVALSLPFIWIGVVLTMKRLRSAGLSTQLVALFFLPVLNLFFFLVLCLVPEREVSSTASKTMLPQDSSLARILPESAMGSAAVSLLLTVPVALGVALLGVQVLENYGWGLFVALPFTLGFAAAFIYGFRRPRSLMGCVGVACLSVALLGAALMALALEGVICLIMATPIALPLAAFGGLCGYQVRRRRFQTDSRVLISALLAVCAGRRVVGASVAHPTAHVCSENVARHSGSTRKSLAAGGRILRDCTADGMDVSSGHRLSDPRRNARERQRRRRLACALSARTCEDASKLEP